MDIWYICALFSPAIAMLVIEVLILMIGLYNEWDNPENFAILPWCVWLYFSVLLINGSLAT